jgi:aspartokinase/homoserine dehydrogenase 1
MVSFEVAGGVENVAKLVTSLECFTLAESLGGVESLVAHPATMTHASMDAESRAAAGITDSLVRLSVGIESSEDLIADLRQALDGLGVRSHAPAYVTRRAHAAHVAIIGGGAIGREVATQIAASGRDDVTVAAIADRTGFVFDADGLRPARIAEVCERKAQGQPLRELHDGETGTVASLVARLRSAENRTRILVDATAAETIPLLLDAIHGGFDVVLANKIPLAGSQTSVDALRAAARVKGKTILHEATVGAGLPVIDTLDKLLASGDDVRSIEGCPSGTLGFIFGALARGVTFSHALREAVARGLTEPDPLVDLSGIDVARKALILGRAIGFRGELSDIIVESLHTDDDEWARRVADARSHDRVLTYRARVTREAITVGTVAVDGATVPAGTWTDNQFAFTTKRYASQPLVIAGPGAGSAVTAAGVFNDVLSLVRRSQRQSSRGSYLNGSSFATETSSASG